MSRRFESVAIRFRMEWDRPTTSTLFVAAFLLFLLVNGCRILDPPYWDALTGVYSQGVWLKQHQFNYALLLKQPVYTSGGPRIDLFCVIAPLFGLLSIFLPPPGVFLIIHLLEIACAAAAMTWLVMILKGSLAPSLAYVWALSAAANPIWSGQTAAIYLEIPAAAASSLSLYWLWKQRYLPAAAACLAGYFIKKSALLLGLTYVIFSFALLLRHLSGSGGRIAGYDWRKHFLLLPYPAMLLLGRWDPLYVTSIHRDILGYFVYFWVKARFLYPTIAVQLLGVFGLAVYGIVKRWNRILENNNGGDFLLVLGIYTAAFWASFVLYPMPLVRYMTSLVVPLTALFALLLSNHRRISLGVAGGILLFNLANQDGRFLAPLPAHRMRSGHELERSREFLKDLDANRRICHYLETRCAGLPIVVKWPFTQMLAIPEFGYVKRPFPGLIEGGQPSILCRTDDLPALLKNGSLGTTLCLYSPNKNEFSWGPSLAPRPGETVMFLDDSIPGADIIFRRSWM